MTAIAAVSLWDRAVSSLSDEDKQFFDLTQTDKTKILADILQAIEHKKQLCLQRRWKYTKKNGDVVILRDLCEKATRWVHKFKDIGDVTSQYDTAHASLPWAAVRFLLQLSVNDVGVFGAMLEGMETVAREITRCHLYKLYPSSASAVRADLDLHLLRHYAGILTYLATARRYYTKSTIRRLGASVFETSDSVEACLSKIAAGRDEVERCTRLIDSEFLQEIDSTTTKIQASIDTLAVDLQSLSTAMSVSQDVQHQSLKAMLASFDQPILRTAAQVSDIHAKLLKEERRKILVWLSTVKYRQHHKTSFDTVMPGSGAWLQQKPEFIDWKTSSTSSILWIRGILGSGKSKLMSTVIQSLLNDKNKNTATSAFAYFYCTRDQAEKARADPHEIMRAIVKQVSCFNTSQPIHAATLCEFRKRQEDAEEDGSDPSKLSLSECKDLILEIADQLPLVVVIDALDQCDPLRRYELIGSFKNIVQKSNNLIKIIVSSRNDSDIVSRLSDVPFVYINSDDNREDVNRFIQKELDKAIDEQRLLQGRLSTSLRERILNDLRSRANGMFLWARLQIQNMCDPERMIVASDVEDALHQLPATLSEQYSGILGRFDRIAPHGQLLARRTLKWLLCARTPLTQWTMLQILQSGGSDISLSVQEVLGLCCNLVVLDKSLNVFRFAHASVREYLELQSGFSLQDINLQAAQECLRLVACGPYFYSGAAYEAYACHFHSYACDFWLDHYSSLDLPFRITQPVANEMKGFFVQGMQDENDWRWRTAPRRDAAYDKGDSPLHLACSYRLLELMETLLSTQDIHLDLKNCAGNTCLWKAALHNFPDMVGMLLRKGADPNKLTDYDQTALHIAAAHGHQTIALLLLQNHTNVGIKDCSGRTAMDWAVKGDHESVVRLLVLNGSYSEAKQKYGQILIDWATSKESSKIQYDVPRIFHRVTGCVGIEYDGWRGSLNAIIHFLYSIRPSHDLFNRDITEKDHFMISYRLKQLLTKMKLLIATVLSEIMVIPEGLPEELCEKLHLPSRDGLSSPFAFMELLFNVSEGRTSWEGPLAVHHCFGSQAMWCFRIDIHGYNVLEQALWPLGMNDGTGSPWYNIPWLQSTSFPSVIMFELQRYWEMVTTNSVKRHDYFTYPANLTMDDLTTSEKTSYVLHGVIVHHGTTIHNEDVFIYLKSHNTGHWIRCQDVLVTWATEEEVFENNFGSDTKPESPRACCTAIGLIYIQEDKISEVARVMVPYGDPPGSP
ncbi:MAG: hypothetical protein Q9169_007725 [Polycauliona sp. 2 TL-2023]